MRPAEDSFLFVVSLNSLDQMSQRTQPRNFKTYASDYDRPCVKSGRCFGRIPKPARISSTARPNRLR